MKFKQFNPFKFLFLRNRMQFNFMKNATRIFNEISKLYKEYYNNI